MRKMGWKEGEGLGKNKEGNKEPILVDFKTDRKGRFFQNVYYTSSNIQDFITIINSSDVSDPELEALLTVYIAFCQEKNV